MFQFEAISQLKYTQVLVSKYTQVLPSNKQTNKNTNKNVALGT